METTQELRYAVRSVILEKINNDCSILEDFTSLDFDDVFDLAEAKLKGDEAYQDLLIKNKLGEFISTEYMDEALKIWKSLDSSNDNDMADDHFTMWEPLENSLTIKQLSEQL